jgi:hypothetical protein
MKARSSSESGRLTRPRSALDRPGIRSVAAGDVQALIWPGGVASNRSAGGTPLSRGTARREVYPSIASPTPSAMSSRSSSVNSMPEIHSACRIISGLTAPASCARAVRARANTAPPAPAAATVFRNRRRAQSGQGSPERAPPEGVGSVCRGKGVDMVFSMRDRVFRGLLRTRSGGVQRRIDPGGRPCRDAPYCAPRQRPRSP